MVSTGITYLDQVTGGLNWGDNVIWEVSSGIPVEHFIKSFFNKGLDKKTRVVFISINSSPYAVCKKYKSIIADYNITLVDAFTHGKGNSDSIFLDFYKKDISKNIEAICVKDPKNIDSFLNVMNDIEKRFQDGSFYFFDSLTGMSELWKDESAVTDFFTFTCPKLYDLNTIAYWIYEKNAHSKEFIASIIHTTQVVFSLKRSIHDNFKLVIKKLEGRSSFNAGGNNYFSIADEKVQFKERKKESLLHIGKIIKEERIKNQMTQSELSVLLEMTSGAVSQIENDHVVPSIPTLLHLSNIFNKSIDFFLGNDELNKNNNYILFDKQHQIQSPGRNIKITRLLNIEDEKIQLYNIIFEKRSLINGTILLHKNSELITIISGSITIFVDNKKINLQKGNSILLKDAFIEYWENNSDYDCEFLYYLL